MTLCTVTAAGLAFCVVVAGCTQAVVCNNRSACHNWRLVLTRVLKLFVSHHVALLRCARRYRFTVQTSSWMAHVSIPGAGAEPASCVVGGAGVTTNSTPTGIIISEGSVRRRLGSHVRQEHVPEQRDDRGDSYAEPAVHRHTSRGKQQARSRLNSAQPRSAVPTARPAVAAIADPAAAMRANPEQHKLALTAGARRRS